MSKTTNKSPSIDIDMLTMALQAGDLDTAWWLDRYSGHVIPAPESDGDSEEQKLLEQKQRNPERFIEIEPIAESVHIELMESYAATLEHEALSQSLYEALQRKRPTWHFRNALSSEPESEDNWYAFKEQFYALQARQWLRDRGLESAEPSDDNPVQGAGTPGEVVQDNPPCLELLLRDIEQLRRYVIWPDNEQLQLAVFIPDHESEERLLSQVVINEYQLAGINRIIETFRVHISAVPTRQALPACLRFNNEAGSGEIRGVSYQGSPFQRLAELLDMLLGIPNVEA